MTAPVLRKRPLLENEHMKVTLWQNTRVSFATYGDGFHLRLHGGYGCAVVFITHRIVPVVVASSPQR